MSLEEKRIVFTGRLSKTRDAMRVEASAAGLIVQFVPSSKTDWLVCGEMASPRKQEMARTCGAKILDEAEYRKRLQGSTDFK